MTVEDYERYMLAEVESGIEGTSIKAGAIKIAITDASLFTAPPFSEQQKMALRAAVRVANATGLSLSVHPPLDMPENVRQVVKLMLQEGMDPGRAVIAHNELFFVNRKIPTLVMDPSSWRLNVDFARELLDRGFNLSIDSFGHYHDAEPLGEVITNDWQRLAGLVALLKAGYASQIVLGTDIFLKILTRRYGGEGYCRLTNFVIPTLRQLDIPASDIQKMIVGNPARILAH
jgi:phosphotriesterase-related protein